MSRFNDFLEMKVMPVAGKVATAASGSAGWYHPDNAIDHCRITFSYSR